MMTGHAGWWGMSVCLFVSAGVLWDHLGLGKGWSSLGCRGSGWLEIPLEASGTDPLGAVLEQSRAEADWRQKIKVRTLRGIFYLLCTCEISKPMVLVAG